MATRLTVKGQVTVPKAVRDHLGVGPGDGVEFAITKSGVEILKADDVGQMRAAIADVRRRRPAGPMPTDAYMALVRDEP